MRRELGKTYSYNLAYSPLYLRHLFLFIVVIFTIHKGVSYAFSTSTQ